MGWILGLTGGAGSGKSTAAAILAEMGYPVVDADQVSRALTAAGGEAMPEIIRVFGSAMAAPDGALDRPKMRELVFRDKDARRKLEAIVHTKLAVRVDRLLYEVHKDAPVVIYDCPLLIESPAARERADRILVIDAPEALQIERLRT
ncbi:MAG: dephospho-CoA kinase, partial [Sutterella wadsworthensis]|nr:dephospho-CoA kinase [Sutterella wadsworthensis]